MNSDHIKELKSIIRKIVGLTIYNDINNVPLSRYIPKPQEKSNNA